MNVLPACPLKLRTLITNTSVAVPYKAFLDRSNSWLISSDDLVGSDRWMILTDWTMLARDSAQTVVEIANMNRVIANMAMFIFAMDSFCLLMINTFNER